MPGSPLFTSPSLATVHPGLCSRKEALLHCCPSPAILGDRELSLGRGRQGSGPP